MACWFGPSKLKSKVGQLSRWISFVSFNSPFLHSSEETIFVNIECRFFKWSSISWIHSLDWYRNIDQQINLNHWDWFFANEFLTIKSICLAKSHLWNTSTLTALCLYGFVPNKSFLRLIYFQFKTCFFWLLEGPPLKSLKKQNRFKQTQPKVVFCRKIGQKHSDRFPLRWCGHFGFGSFKSSGCCMDFPGSGGRLRLEGCDATRTNP